MVYTLASDVTAVEPLPNDLGVGTGVILVYTTIQIKITLKKFWIGWYMKSDAWREEYMIDAKSDSELAALCD